MRELTTRIRRALPVPIDGLCGVLNAWVVAPDLPGTSGMTEPSVGERSLLILEAARRLGVSRRTVYYRIRDGVLRTIRTRGGSQRVLVSSIERLQQELSRPTGEAASESEPLPLQIEPLA